MKANFLFITLFSFSICLAQSRTVSAGKILTTANQKMTFTNLRLDDSEVRFINTETRSEFIYLLNSIRYIEDADANLVFGTKPEKKETQPEKPQTKTAYPDGIYKTKEDFLSKKPSGHRSVSPRQLGNSGTDFAGKDEEQVFFRYDDSDAKVRNTFAIVWNGRLYFQAKAILGNRNRDDRAQDSDFSNSFCQVLIEGDNYLYAEADLGNLWAKAVGVNFGVSASTFNSRKGIVWDVKKQEFNIFRDCRDFNTFLAEVKPDAVIDCDRNDGYTPTAVQQIIASVK